MPATTTQPFPTFAVNLPTPVEWRDLCQPNHWHAFVEVSRPLVLITGSIGFAFASYYLVSLVMLFFGHIAALRSAHGAVHKTLGLPRSMNRYLLYGVSGLLFTSCHALEFTHRIHHRRCCQAEDIEGRIAHANFWKACVISPWYHGLVITAAWRQGDDKCRKSVVIDLLVAVFIHGVLTLAIGKSILVFWVGLALLNSSSGLLSVWLFHRGGNVTRSGRWTLLNWVAMGMLYHGEHHRYPGVPTARLGELAKRLRSARQQPEGLI